MLYDGEYLVGSGFDSANDELIIQESDRDTLSLPDRHSQDPVVHFRLFFGNPDDPADDARYNPKGTRSSFVNIHCLVCAL